MRENSSFDKLAYIVNLETISNQLDPGKLLSVIKRSILLHTMYLQLEKIY